jgi:hypothetical protein
VGPASGWEDKQGWQLLPLPLLAALAWVGGAAERTSRRRSCRRHCYLPLSHKTTGSCWAHCEAAAGRDAKPEPWPPPLLVDAVEDAGAAGQVCVPRASVGGQ